MAIIDLFSKRRKRERGEAPDVFVYDQIPTALRVQLCHAMRDVVGASSVYDSPANDVYARIIAREGRHAG